MRTTIIALALTAASAFQFQAAPRRAPATVRNAAPQEGDLSGKVAFVAGVADSTGYGWAIAKSLAEAGCKIIVGTWPPVLAIFKKSLEGGKMDADRELSGPPRGHAGAPQRAPSCLIEPRVGVPGQAGRPNSSGLVLGCIDAEFCNQSHI